MQSMMQSSMNQGVQARSSASRLSTRNSTASFGAPLPRRQQGRHARITPQALSPVTIVGSALIVGAWYLNQQQLLEQDRLEASDRPCPSCGGSGVEPCFCTKWSDGDVGCSSCSSSGYTKCKSCGGGGMAVPIKVSIRKNEGL